MLASYARDYVASGLIVSNTVYTYTYTYKLNAHTLLYVCMHYKYAN